MSKPAYRMNNPVPKVAAIHDLSGYGRSSLTIVLPVLSALGVQACPLPTALLSTQTSGFEDYYFLDLTEPMEKIIDHWKTLDIHFDAIYSGFLGSPRQADIVAGFIEDFYRDNQLVAVDPVLGDDGETYGPFDGEMIRSMRKLITKADMITPNYTEAAFLLNEPYEKMVTVSKMKEWLVRLSEMGPSKVIITSVPITGDEKLSQVMAYERMDGRFWKTGCSHIPAKYPGTGDMFAGVVVGSLLKGDNLPVSLDRAVQFISLAIRSTFGYQVPDREGVLLEKVLYHLHSPVASNSYEIVE